MDEFDTSEISEETNKEHRYLQGNSDKKEKKKEQDQRIAEVRKAKSRMA